MDISSQNTVSQKIYTAQTADQVYNLLTKIHPDASLFFDVDNTLITPRSSLFRLTSPYNTLIDYIKLKKEQFPNYETIISNWRRTRKSMLVDEDWPVILNRLKQNYAVFGLTKMDTGPFGSIPSMEEWRYEELSKLGLYFSQSPESISHPLILTHDASCSSAICHKGIFMTGSYTKKDVVLALSKFMTFSGLGLVDDRLEMLEEVEEACKILGIPFTGILFKGMENLEGTPRPIVAELQKQHLLNVGEWLEDEEAAKIMAGVIGRRKE